VSRSKLDPVRSDAERARALLHSLSCACTLCVRVWPKGRASCFGILRPGLATEQAKVAR
jgi:hypothetical protein